MLSPEKVAKAQVLAAGGSKGPTEHLEWSKSWFNGLEECNVALALRIMGGGGGTSGGVSSYNGSDKGYNTAGPGALVFGDGTIDATSSFKANRIAKTDGGLRRLRYQQRMAALLYR